MEPVLGGRDDCDAAGLSETTWKAAMEPVLGGRDDAASSGVSSRAAAMPQWSPSLADGTTGMLIPTPSPHRTCRNGARPWRTGRLAGGGSCSPPRCKPQWSPSLADGTTVQARGRHPQLRVAAMEPVLGGRDDQRRDGAAGLGVRAAMEPVLGGRDDCVPCRQEPPEYSAAMEPVLGGRDDLTRRVADNAARISPQWSPSLADGTTCLPARHLPLARLGRNGARPWRTGRPPRGKHIATHERAAMEPVLGGRDDRRPGHAGRRDRGAAMEPVLGGRDDSRRLTSSTGGNSAAMEPVLGGRDDR